MSINNYFRTSDISLATLVSLSYPLWAIERKNRSKAEFLFKREEGLDNLIESFWRGELRVDPLKYFNALKVIKSRLY